MSHIALFLSFINFTLLITKYIISCIYLLYIYIYDNIDPVIFVNENNNQPSACNGQVILLTHFTQHHSEL